jgi:hypothetical protein
MSKSREDAVALGGCGCWIAVLVFNVALGGWSVNYLLDFFLQKNIPFIFDTIIGFFVAEISVPVAIVVAILHYCGVV